MAAIRLITADALKVKRILRQARIKATVTASLKQYIKLAKGHRLNVWCGWESSTRTATRNERLVRGAARTYLNLGWHEALPTNRWLSYLPKATRKRLQPCLPIACMFSIGHGMVLLVADVWADRRVSRGRMRWHVHRPDGPAVVTKDAKGYAFWNWNAKPESILDPPTTERILAETNVTDREVLIQRMGLENFIAQAGLTEVDKCEERGAVLLKRAANTEREWAEENLTYVAVTCPSTKKQYFLRVPPATKTALEALEWTAHGRMPYSALAVET